jgi:Xaa-Pro aminopeptidase
MVKCPIQKKLVDVELLTAGERAWLDAYHAETLEKVSPLLQNDPRALEWLKRECSPL